MKTQIKINKQIILTRNDLNRLKELSKKIQYCAEAEEKLTALSNSIVRSSASEKAKNRFRAGIEKLTLRKYLDEYNTLFVKYSSYAQNRLEPLERAIFIDYYINGSTLETIAKKTYYSVSGIKKKLDKIIIKLAKGT